MAHVQEIPVLVVGLQFLFSEHIAKKFPADF